MSVDLRHVLSVLFDALGLGTAPQMPAESEVFEVDEARCTATRSPYGSGVLLSLDIGSLTRDAYAGADRLRRLLRASLGFAVVNRAALVCDDLPGEAALRALQVGAPDAPVLRFKAVALIDSAHPDDIIAALQDVLQIRAFAVQYLSPDEGTAPDPFPPSPTRAAQGRDPRDDGGSFLIFKP